MKDAFVDWSESKILPGSRGDINKIAEALAKAQAVMGHPIKKHTAGTGSFKYTYADLPAVIDAVKLPFSSNGLSFTQLPEVDMITKTVNLTTILMHVSGQYISSVLAMGFADLKPQTIGSSITYARRYALSAMAGISSEDDDDGSAGSGKVLPKFESKGNK